MRRGVLPRVPVLILALLASAPSPNAQDHGWFPIERFVVGDQADHVVAEDVDGDGVRDVVTANSADQDLSFLRGRGDGSFDQVLPLALGALPTGVTPLALAAADVTGDGRADLVALSGALGAHPAQFHVLPGLVGGGFGSAVVTPLAIKPDATLVEPLALGDVDGDGRADALVANVPLLFGPQGVLHRGQPDGSFGPAQSLNLGQNARLLRLRDLDGDGALDLLDAARPEQAWLLAVRRGTGSGSFLPAVQQPLADTPQALDVADLDGDGVPDVVVALGDALAPVVQALAPFHGAGDGTLALWPLLPSPGAIQRLALADTGGDGLPDVICARWPGPFPGGDSLLVVLRNLGGGAFEELPASPLHKLHALRAADLDGDGRAEVLTTHGPFPDILTDPFIGLLSVRRALPDGQLEAQAPLEAGSGYVVALHVADLVADGHVDVLVRDSAYALRLLPGAGDGTFGASQTLPATGFPIAEAVGDLDEDGRDDLVVLQALPAPAVSLQLNGPDGLQPPLDWPTEKPWTSTGASLVVADVDGDGHLDALHTAADASWLPQLALLAGDGAGHLGVAAVQPLPFAVIGLVAADLDGDGALDLVGSHGIGIEPPAVLLGLGDGGFSPPAVLPAGMFSARVADLEQDGVPDLVTFQGDVALVRTLRGQGDGTFEPAVDWPMPAGVFDVHVADLDRDSRDDIVVGAAGSNSLFVLRGLGSGQLGEVRVHEAGNLGLLASGDADEDGYPELLSAPVFQSGKPMLLLHNQSSPWTDLGFGLSASFGQPTLQAVGPGEADLPITLGWSGALPPSQGFLVAGFSAALLPFHGGTLVPEPQVTLPVHAQGEISVRWPAGVPEGTQLFVQGWFFGPQAEPEFSATQAVVLTTP